MVPFLSLNLLQLVPLIDIVGMPIRAKKVISTDATSGKDRDVAAKHELNIGTQR